MFDRPITLREVLAATVIGIFIWVVYQTYFDHMILQQIVSFLSHGG